MAYFHITSSGAVNLMKGYVSKVVITNNAAYGGTITISDETGTAGTPIVGVIATPAVGNRFEYWDMGNGLTINPSGTCDITVNTSSSFGAK